MARKRARLFVSFSAIRVIKGNKNPTASARVAARQRTLQVHNVVDAGLRYRFLLEREVFAKLSEFFVVKSRCVAVDFLQPLYPLWGDDVVIDE